MKLGNAFCNNKHFFLVMSRFNVNITTRADRTESLCCCAQYVRWLLIDYWLSNDNERYDANANNQPQQQQATMQMFPTPNRRGSVTISDSDFNISRVVESGRA